MTTRLIVLNGGSSAGKTSIARALQTLLTEPWLTFGVDTLIDAMPPAARVPAGGIDFAADGSVAVGAGFRELEAAYLAGLAAMVRAGARLVVDDVFLGGAASQARTRAAFADLPVLWVGVRCDPATATAREAARPDRVPGMAASQAEPVHHGVHYDIEVDTARSDARTCAAAIAARLRHDAAR